MILTQLSQIEAFVGDNFSVIITAVVLAIILIGHLYNKYRTAKAKIGEDGIEAVKEFINSLFSEERFQILAEQCIQDSVNALVKGTTKEQFIENFKDNICDALYDFIKTEYPKYNVICSRDNIEKLADNILDMIGFDEDKISDTYLEQVNKLNEKDEEE